MKLSLAALSTYLKAISRHQLVLDAMTKQHISHALKRFVREQIQTVPRLEVLLLLHRDELRALSVAEVANELAFESDIAEDQLIELKRMRLVVSNSNGTRYQYQPSSASLRTMVDRLAVAYSKQRIPILSAILAEDPSHIQRFIEAFKFVRSSG